MATLKEIMERRNHSCSFVSTQAGVPLNSVKNARMTNRAPGHIVEKLRAYYGEDLEIGISRHYKLFTFGARCIECGEPVTATEDDPEPCYCVKCAPWALKRDEEIWRNADPRRLEDVACAVIRRAFADYRIALSTPNNRHVASARKIKRDILSPAFGVYNFAGVDLALACELIEQEYGVEIPPKRRKK